MKRIALGTVEHDGHDAPVTALFMELLDSSPDMVNGRPGITPAAMRQRIRLMDKLDVAKDAPGILVDDADHALLMRLFSSTGFKRVSRGILEIEDRLRDAKTE